MKKQVSVDLAMQAQLGILSKYAEDNTEEIEKIISGFNQPSIHKYAGIYIDNPNQENIEDFIRKYMYNELSFFPRVLTIDVRLTPNSFDRAKKDIVDTGSGIVSIDVRGKKVELPFMISDGQLDPFDVIQLDGQRCPYSRDNLQKIIINLDKQIEQEQSGGPAISINAYKTLSDFNNPSTVPGFMGDVLSIRDAQTSRRGNGTYVVASSEYTDMEKLAFFGTTHLDYNVDDFRKSKEEQIEPTQVEKVAKEETKPFSMKERLSEMVSKGGECRE